MPWYVWLALLIYGGASLLIAFTVYLMSNPATDNRLWEAFKAFWLWLPWLVKEAAKALLN